MNYLFLMSRQFECYDLFYYWLTHPINDEYGISYHHLDQVKEQINQYYLIHKVGKKITRELVINIQKIHPKITIELINSIYANQYLILKSIKK